MKLSVVILNYNVRYFLELCLQSVQKAIQEIEAEILVVDNNSNDDSCEMVRSQFPDVILIENKENIGFAAGNNIGVRNAKGEYLCVLNPDTVIAEDTFTTLLSFAEKQERLGIIGCKLINGKGQFLPESKRNVPTVKVATRKMLGNSVDYYAYHLDENESGEVDILVGAFMVLKKSVFEKVDGFDEDYFMYGEDIDLSYKILKAGLKNFYNPDTTVIHFKGESTLKDKTYAKRFFKAMQIFYKKHFRKNFVIDALVNLGVLFAYFLRKSPKLKFISPNNYLIISKKTISFFKKLDDKNLIISSDLEDLKEGTEIILDADYLPFKKIIEYISDKRINSKATFKILPKNANYIIGSNDSSVRGEVINL